MSFARLTVATAALLVGLLAACSSLPAGRSTQSVPTSPAASMPVASSQPSATPSPLPSPSASPGSAEQVSSPAQAAAIVFASQPIFSSITPANPGAVGQSSSYEAYDMGDGYSVTIRMGSGDCPSGCINQHTWQYKVSRSGAIKLVAEQGDAVEVSVDHGTGDAATVTIRLVAGPVCPVERNPPDPSCAPHPVQDAEVVLRDPSGAQVAHATANANGEATFTVPGGAYYVESSAVEGLMGQASPVAFSVPGGRTASVTMEYDTGIR